MKKLSLTSFLLCSLFYLNNVYALHGSFPPPPEGQVFGTMEIIIPGTSPDTIILDSTSLNGQQTWDIVSSLAWPSSFSSGTQSDSNTTLMGYPWSINIIGTYNGFTDTGSNLLRNTVGNNQLGMLFDMSWNINGVNETFSNLTQVWDVIDLSNGDTLLQAIDLDGNGGIGSTLSSNGSILDGLSLSMSFVSTVPVPAAAWLFSSGLLSLFAFARRRK